MHVPPEGVLVSHSVAECFLFVSLTYCPACRRRPVRAEGDLRRGAPPNPWQLDVACSHCDFRAPLTFTIEPPPRAPPSARINATIEPSRLIDAAGWLALFKAIVDGAAGEPDREESRALMIEAAECLDEATKFYTPGRELPPETAFYDERSSQRFRDHPEQFRRSRLEELKRKLPHDRSAAPPMSRQQKRWWKFWI
jgi:hypothetical protein